MWSNGIGLGRQRNQYFAKHYPWLQFFKSESPILTAESGWKFCIEWIAVTPQIFEKLYVAGIVQLFEGWTHMVTPRRVNITRKVRSLVEHRETEIVKKISLGGNIQAIFFIYLFLIMISVTEILIVELKVLYRIWRGRFVVRYWFVMKWRHFVQMMHSN